MFVKIFNFLPGISETQFLVQYELCECKCRLNETAYSSKQKWNQDKCLCKFKRIRWLEFL